MKGKRLFLLIVKAFGARSEKICTMQVFIHTVAISRMCLILSLLIPNKSVITGNPKMSTIMKAFGKLKNCQLGRFTKLQGVNLNYNVCTTLITIVFVRL